VTHHRTATAGFRYLIVGTTSLVTYISVSSGLHRGLDTDLITANAIGYTTSTVLNYIANFYWAFRTSRSHLGASWRFLAIVLVGIGMNSLYVALVSDFTWLPLELIGISFMAIWPIISFFALHLWALR
jgi:putative flippase GtrA